MKELVMRQWSPTARVLLYVVIPVAVPFSLIAMYFSGVPALQHVVSPCIPGVPLDSNREFGLLENLQNLCLFGVIATALAGALRKEHKMEKAVFAGVAVFALFILLEEIDYGLHFYEMAHGWKLERIDSVRNLHNTYDLTNIIKHAALAIMAVLFVIFPMAFKNSPNSLRRYIAPDRLAIVTMVCMFLTRTLAHKLKALGVGDPGTIHHNLSEFRELTTYYIFVLYLVDVVFRRTRCGVDKAPETLDSAHEVG